MSARAAETATVRVLHVNASDLAGGAARAAHRIHRSLRDHGSSCGLSSRMRVMSRHGSDAHVIGPSAQTARSPWQVLLPWLNRASRLRFRTADPAMLSTARFRTGLGVELRERYREDEFDLVHLHWLGDTTLSIEEVGTLWMPVVWTLHDQWAFCGAEHYTPPPGLVTAPRERFVDAYASAHRPPYEKGPDINQRTWHRKQRAWTRSMHLVAPSRWMAESARRSALVGTWPIHVVPNPIDLDQWAPIEQTRARASLGLPQGVPVVLFGAADGMKDSRKGADLLLLALRELTSRTDVSPLADLVLVVFGGDRRQHTPDSGVTVHQVGCIRDDARLRLLYSAADVFVIPSRQDNLPNTGIEAHACGTPVVAFDTGGLPDIVEHRRTGALAPPFDPAALAREIQWVLEDPERRRRLGMAARARAETLWAPERIARLYADVYADATLTPSR